MNFKPSRTFAEELMNEFIENNLVNYSKLRNFDYGPDKRSNVSCLSPYVTHGVISEVELIKKGFQEEYILYILGVIKSKEIDKKKKKHAVELTKFKLFFPVILAESWSGKSSIGFGLPRCRICRYL